MSHEWTGQRISHLGGSLPKRVLDSLAVLNPTSVLEFGAGYSSAFLSHVWRDKVPYVCFEHHPNWHAQVAPLVRCNGGTCHFMSLRSFTADQADTIYRSDDPVAAYCDISLTAPIVPKEHLDRSNNPGAFYSPDFLEHVDPHADLVILDGPNGGGRMLAFPLLRHLLGWFRIYVDDLHCAEHRFEYHFRRVFPEAKVLFQYAGPSGQRGTLWEVEE